MLSIPTEISRSLVLPSGAYSITQMNRFVLVETLIGTRVSYCSGISLQALMHI